MHKNQRQPTKQTKERTIFCRDHLKCFLVFHFLPFSTHSAVRCSVLPHDTQMYPYFRSKSFFYTKYKRTHNLARTIIFLHFGDIRRMSGRTNERISEQEGCKKHALKAGWQLSRAERWLNILTQKKSKSERERGREKNKDRIHCNHQSLM